MLNIHVYGILEPASIFLFACKSMVTQTSHFDKYSFPLYCCWISQITQHVTMSIKKKHTVEKKNNIIFFEVWPPWNVIWLQLFRKWFQFFNWCGSIWPRQFLSSVTQILWLLCIHFIKYYNNRSLTLTKYQFDKI